MSPTSYLYGLTPIEILLLSYLVPTTLLAVIRRRFLASRRAFLSIRCLAIASIYSMRWLPVPTWVRDWYPVSGYFFLYEEIAYLNRLVTQRFFDKSVIRADQRVFGGQPSMFVSEQLPYLWLSDFLSMSYLAYYVLTPAICFLFYFSGHHEAFRETTFIVMLTFHACFWSYIFFPVASPYYEFPDIGEPHAKRFFFRTISLLLDHGSAKGSAFPSSHVAIGLTLLMCVSTFHVSASYVIAPFVIGLALATVYGRYHYALDSFAGVIVAVSCYPLGRWLYMFLQ